MSALVAKHVLQWASESVCESEEDKQFGDRREAAVACLGQHNGDYIQD